MSRARARIAAAVQARDSEIHRLRRDHRLTMAAIAIAVGCSSSHVHEVLNPDRHAAYASRRRAHWRVYSGGRAA
jgi:hypothetical protein